MSAFAHPSRALAAFLLFSGLLCAQDNVPTFKSKVDVVDVLTTVRDKDGHIVNNLTKDDFQLEEDGRPQTVKYFRKDTELPLTLGLLVDTSPSQRRLIGEERSASFAFLRRVLREDRDSAFVVHFDWVIEVLQDLTSSKDQLNAALNDVAMTAPDQRDIDTDPGGWSRHRHYSGGGTNLYDAVYAASDQLMKQQRGRKALILLSDGVDTGSKLPLDSAIQKALATDTMVYSILFSDPDAYGSHRIFIDPGWGGRGGWGIPIPIPQQRPENGKKVLQQISKQTGGRFFEVSKKQSLAEIYQEIEEELRNQYSLGYTPDKRIPGYHTIKVTANDKNLTVVAREGYYATASEADLASQRP
jgi:VWFA-related protein